VIFLILAAGISTIPPPALGLMTMPWKMSSASSPSKDSAVPISDESAATTGTR
jgi:hypothetical protein